MEFVSIFAFLLINLFLGLKANRVKKSQAGSQTVAIYSVWSGLVFGMIVTTLAKDYHWQRVDTVTLAFDVVGTVFILAVGRNFHLSITDPMVRGWLALIFKSIPQVMLAISIWNVGGDSLPATAVIVGHITVCMRLTQIWLATREHGWDRARRGMALSEIGNEASWALATMAWYFR